MESIGEEILFFIFNFCSFFVESLRHDCATNHTMSINRLRLAIADRNEWPNCIQPFVGRRYYWEVINLSFALPGSYLNILETEKILQFCDVRNAKFHLQSFSINLYHQTLNLKFQYCNTVNYTAKDVYKFRVCHFMKFKPRCL